MFFLLAFVVFSFVVFSFVVKFMGLSSMDFFLFYSSENFIFFSTLSVIFFSICAFSFYYFSSGVDLVRFYLLFLSFGFSMFLMIFHGSVFSLILAWDGLGVSSFFLVAFYMNWSSINGAMITVLTNRFGDFCLFWFFCSIILSPTFLFSFGACVLLLSGAMTKSAQFPFSSWLPMAMAAPTPVSALVHSSTLVTAGIFLILRYFFFLESKSFLCLLFCFGSLTVFVSGLSSLFEQDFKKVVALSTLSQMGFLIITLSLMLPCLCFFHLITHAFFKSCLFIQVGIFITYFFGNQENRKFNNMIFSSPLVSFYSFISIFSLCGLFFLSGFFSKEAILLFFMSKSTSAFFVLIIWSSICLTFLYSFRLIWGMCSGSPHLFWSKMNLGSTWYSMILVISGVFIGYLMNFNSLMIFSFLVGEEKFFPTFFLVSVFFVFFNWSKILVYFQGLLFLDYFSSSFMYFIKKPVKILDSFLLTKQKTISIDLLYFSMMLQSSISSKMVYLGLFVVFLFLLFCCKSF